MTIPFLTSELAAFPNRDRNRHRLHCCQSRNLRPREKQQAHTEPLANPNLWAARPRHLPRPLCWRVLVLVSSPKRHILCLILKEIFVLVTCLWCTSSMCPGPEGLGPGELPHPGIKLGSPALQVDSLPAKPPGKPILYILVQIQYIHRSKEKQEDVKQNAAFLVAAL